MTRQLDNLHINAEAGARSGPAGRQDWMQGYGDPTDQTDVVAGELRQQQLGEIPADVTALMDHWETTKLRIQLDPGCPEYESLYAIEGESIFEMEATEECTNDAGDPCPVELSTAGWIFGSMEGPGHFATEVRENLGSAPDDLDRDPMSEPDVDAFTPRPGHDHAEKNRVALEKSSSDASSEDYYDDTVEILVDLDVLIGASQIVPEETWPTTERVSARVKTLVTHDLTVNASLDPQECESNGCCGHGTCHCRADFQVSLTRQGSTIHIRTDNKTYTLHRKPTSPTGPQPDQSWDLRPVK